MSKKAHIRRSKRLHQLKKINSSERLKLAPLVVSIKDIIALGGLAIGSSGAWADAQINPNEIWLNPGSLRGICVQDRDQDGDLDVFQIYQEFVTLLENIGTPESPDFATPLPFANDTGNFNLNRLGLTDCQYYDNTSVLVDIDADDDLDLFRASSTKGEIIKYARNDGTSEQPVYIFDDPKKRFNLAEFAFRFMFRDIDNDGDVDFFNRDELGFFHENIGTPKLADFATRKSPVPVSCDSGLGFYVDLNNDAQWDILCRNYKDDSFDYIESSASGYLPKRKLLNAIRTEGFSALHPIDIDNDGDIDILSISNNEFVLFTNLGSSLLPQFDNGNLRSTPILDLQLAGLTLSDLDADGDIDYIFNAKDSGLKYANNIGTNINPVYEVSGIEQVFSQCNKSLAEIDGVKGSIALVDIDGDNDLDLFTHFKLEGTKDINVYCENQGSTTNPLFASGVIDPFGLITKGIGQQRRIFFGDIDGDGDQDAWIDSIFYDNVGTSQNPLFRQISHSLLYSFSSFVSLVDMDGDGQIDSTIDRKKGLQLLYNNLEPATDVTTIALQNGPLIIATNRPSQVQLQDCDVSNVQTNCRKTIVLPGIAEKLSLSAGDFTNNGREDIVLAMIDGEGHLKIEIFDDNLKLIGSGAGGIADSVSVSTGQLDDDPEDEYVVSLVQSDGRVAAITFNLDGSRVGKVVANEGKQPSVDVGNFGGTGDAYVLAYLTPDDRLETAVLQGDGTLIGQGSGGHASHIRVTAAELLSSNPGDEYAISLVQADGTVALIGFAADGTRLGKVAGGISHQPKVISSNFSHELVPNEIPGVGELPGISFETSDDRLAVSVILSDKRPAIIFLDNKGKHIGTGVGGVAASVATIELLDTNNNEIDDTGVLVYLDEAGNPRLEVFGTDGIKK